MRNESFREERYLVSTDCQMHFEVRLYRGFSMFCWGYSCLDKRPAILKCTRNADKHISQNCIVHRMKSFRILSL